MKEKVHKKNLLLVKVSGKNYFFDLNFVERVENTFDISPIPFVEDYIEGVLHFGGEIWVIISIKKFIGETAEEDLSKDLLLLLKKDDYFIGLLCDEVEGIYSSSQLPFRKVDREKDDVDFDSVSEIYTLDGEPVYKIDFESFIKELGRF